jgi:outer membrane protein OmpA-like peptidoglycan-associated protein
MIRLKEGYSTRDINAVLDDIEARLRKLESDTSVVISGYTATLNEGAGKLTLTKGDKIVTFSKD